MKNFRIRLLELFIILLSRVSMFLKGYMNGFIIKRNLLAYDDRSSDIFIVTYPKSGTTWVQNLVVEILSGGKAEFEHIYQASPFLENLRPRLHTLPEPRILKTHLNYKKAPKGRGKYIYVMRHGLDVAISYYRHYQNFHGYRGPFPHFFDTFIKGKAAYGSWFEHVRDWQANPQNLDVLFISYEELMEDLEGGLRKIATFCGHELSEENVPNILERCSFSYMKENEQKFNLAYWEIIRKGMTTNQFIRKGKINQWEEELKPEQLEAYRQKFKEHFEDEALASYRV